jgi:hypothetical protein
LLSDDIIFAMKLFAAIFVRHAMKRHRRFAPQRLMLSARISSRATPPSRRAAEVISVYASLSFAEAVREIAVRDIPAMALIFREIRAVLMIRDTRSRQPRKARTRRSS